MQIDAFPLLKAIARHTIGDLSPNDFAVYMRLVLLDNELHWREWFSVTYERLCLETCIRKPDTIQTVVNRLQQKGYIEVRRGGKHKTNEYKIVPIYMNYPVERDNNRDNYRDNVRDNCRDNNRDNYRDNYRELNKTKTKTKTKTNISSSDVYDVDGFAEFWAAYPRKVGKAKAAESYAKIAPSKELQEIMLRAVAVASRSQQWQKDGGQFIPHAATWLNQRRWEDEVNAETPTASRHLTDEEYAQIRDKMQAKIIAELKEANGA